MACTLDATPVRDPRLQVPGNGKLTTDAKHLGSSISDLREGKGHMRCQHRLGSVAVVFWLRW